MRRTRLVALVLSAVAVAAIATAVVLAGRGGGDRAAATAPARSALLAGIPQRGLELGDPDAPALVEYADLQCPYCRDFSATVLPALVRDYVRTGKAKLVFHGLAFIGPDSGRALRAVEAAGLQNRLWDVADALYANQGAENSGWVSDELLERVGRGVAGLDVERWLDETDSAVVDARIAAAARAATDAGVRGTPSFVLGGRQLRVAALDPAAFRDVLDPLLAQIGRGAATTSR